MFGEIFSEWLQFLRDTDPEMLRNWVYLAQAGLGALVILGFFWVRNRETPSGFRVREGELRKKAASFRERDQLSGSKIAASNETLRLEGISLSGKAHEILGVAVQASETEIQKAWRELMKRYHPDRVGRPGSREWKDAQKIAEAINRAKDEMIASRRPRK